MASCPQTNDTSLWLRGATVVPAAGIAAPAAGAAAGAPHATEASDARGEREGNEHESHGGQKVPVSEIPPNEGDALGATIARGVAARAGVEVAKR